MRCISLAWLVACGRPEAEGPTCVDPPRGPAAMELANVTRTAIDFTYEEGGFRGSGLAIADLDGDGRSDIVAGRRDGGLAWFANRGSLRFERQRANGLDETLGARAIGAADLDNDGDVDLVVAGANAAVVLVNDGRGAFREATRFDGSGMTEHVLPVDLDGDGRLDLYFGNHDILSQENTENRLYLNRGDWRFEASRLGDGLTWTTTAFDADEDGDQDLYVANDTLLYDFGDAPVEPDGRLPVDLFLRNDGAGVDGLPRFTNIVTEVGLAMPRSSMGGVVNDFDEDGRLDLYIPDYGAKKLFVHAPDGQFVDRAAELGLLAPRRLSAHCAPDDRTEACLLLSWSAAVADFDLDGHDEILVANGETSPDDHPPVLLFTRTPDGTYEERSPDIPCMDARALIATDLDGDGDQDVAIAHKDGPLEIYEVRGRPTPGTWLRVTLHGRTSNREGLGAVVRLRMASGRVRTRAIGAGGIVHAAGPAEAVFGLGDDRVRTVEVRWPSGRRTIVSAPVTGAVVIDEDQ